MPKLNTIFSLILLMLILATACTKKSNEQNFSNINQGIVTDTVSIGEKAPYKIKGDTVIVNNQICAVSGSSMKKEDLEKWTNIVIYNGNNKKFNGKKLVFNQCCEGCVQKFPPMWQEKSEEIVKFHGLN